MRVSTGRAAQGSGKTEEPREQSGWSKVQSNTQAGLAGFFFAKSLEYLIVIFFIIIISAAPSTEALLKHY